jgi:hypothetical protein
VAEIKQAAVKNKQELAQYTWQEQQTISIKGEVKKQKRFLVRLGPDARPQKTEINPQEQSSGGRKHGLKHRIVQKKTEEFEEYAKQIAALAQRYAQLCPERLQQLYQQGNIAIGLAGRPGEVRLVIQSCLKAGDSLTLVFDLARKALASISVSSYLDTPKNAVRFSAQYVQEQGLPNHISSLVVNGVSKQLTVAMQNSNYQRL